MPRTTHTTPRLNFTATASARKVARCGREQFEAPLKTIARSPVITVLQRYHPASTALPIMKTALRTTAIVVAVLCVCICGAAAKKKRVPAWRTIDQSETKYRISTAGRQNARTMEAGDTLTLHVMGMVKKTMKTFMDTIKLGNGKPFVYKVNAGPGIVGTIVSGGDRGAEIALVPGFSHGLFANGGIKEGEIREMDISAAEAFGAKGHKRRGITPNSSLFIRVKVEKIAKAGKLEPAQKKDEI